jgi:hypothetical protein
MGHTCLSEENERITVIGRVNVFPGAEQKRTHCVRQQTTPEARGASWFSVQAQSLTTALDRSGYLRCAFSLHILLQTSSPVTLEGIALLV